MGELGPSGFGLDEFGWATAGRVVPSYAELGSAGTDAIGINLDGFGWTWL